MFDARTDQADGLRRLSFARRPALIPLGCVAAAVDCRNAAASIVARLHANGSTPKLLDRLDAQAPLGGLATAAGIDRVVLLEDPLRLAHWLHGRGAALPLLLSADADALQPQYAVLKAIVLASGMTRFAALYVDAVNADEAALAQARLAACARRFLAVEVAALGTVGAAAAGPDGASGGAAGQRMPGSPVDRLAPDGIADHAPGGLADRLADYAIALAGEEAAVGLRGGPAMQPEDDGALPAMRARDARDLAGPARAH